jgi:DNA-binding NarL/FixJ family response regulator
VRVVLADLHGASHSAIADLLDGLEGVELVGEARARRDLAAALRRHRPDVLIIDERLIDSTEHVLSGLGPRSQLVRVIVLGMIDDPAYAARAQRLGADAWVAKDRAADELPSLLEAP